MNYMSTRSVRNFHVGKKDGGHCKIECCLTTFSNLNQQHVMDHVTHMHKGMQRLVIPPIYSHYGLTFICLDTGFEYRESVSRRNSCHRLLREAAGMGILQGNVRCWG